mmetsp:Transcript_25053/g.28620  ORF Transcript_25053/g.28620 Transcript_25053/m.28620 type:complete len:525 (-) Transcript_25053:187-1761(-)
MEADNQPSSALKTPHIDEIEHICIFPFSIDSNQDIVIAFRRGHGQEGPKEKFYRDFGGKRNSKFDSTIYHLAARQLLRKSHGLMRPHVLEKLIQYGSTTELDLIKRTQIRYHSPQLQAELKVMCDLPGYLWSNGIRNLVILFYPTVFFDAESANLTLERGNFGSTSIHWFPLKKILDKRFQKIFSSFHLQILADFNSNLLCHHLTSGQNIMESSPVRFAVVNCEELGFLAGTYLSSIYSGFRKTGEHWRYYDGTQGEFPTLNDLKQLNGLIITDMDPKFLEVLSTGDERDPGNKSDGINKDEEVQKNGSKVEENKEAKIKEAKKSKIELPKWIAKLKKFMLCICTDFKNLKVVTLGASSLFMVRTLGISLERCHTKSNTPLNRCFTSGKLKLDLDTAQTLNFHYCKERSVPIITNSPFRLKQGSGSPVEGLVEVKTEENFPGILLMQSPQLLALNFHPELSQSQYDDAMFFSLLRNDRLDESCHSEIQDHTTTHPLSIQADLLTDISEFLHSNSPSIQKSFYPQ